MSLAAPELELAKEKKQDTTIRLRFESAELLRDAARLRRLSIAEFVHQVLDPVVRRDLESQMKKRLARGDKPE